MMELDLDSLVDAQHSKKKKDNVPPTRNIIKMEVNNENDSVYLNSALSQPRRRLFPQLFPNCLQFQEQFPSVPTRNYHLNPHSSSVHRQNGILASNRNCHVIKSRRNRSARVYVKGRWSKNPELPDLPCTELYCPEMFKSVLLRAFHVQQTHTSRGGAKTGFKWISRKYWSKLIIGSRGSEDLDAWLPASLRFSATPTLRVKPDPDAQSDLQQMDQSQPSEPESSPKVIQNVRPFNSSSLPLTSIDAIFQSLGQ